MEKQRGVWCVGLDAVQQLPQTRLEHLPPELRTHLQGVLGPVVVALLDDIDEISHLAQGAGPVLELEPDDLVAEGIGHGPVGRQVAVEVVEAPQPLPHFHHSRTDAAEDEGIPRVADRLGAIP